MAKRLPDGVAPNLIWFFLALTLLSILMLAWPVPGTIALRNILLVVLSLMVLLVNWRYRKVNTGITLPKWPARLLLGLTFWICIVIALWGQEPALSWREFFPQWVLPLLVGLVGWGLVRWSVLCNRQQALVKTLFLVLLSGVLIQVVLSALYFVKTGQPPFRQASALYIPRIIDNWQSGTSFLQAFDSSAGEKASFVNNMFIALVLTEIGQRVLTRNRWLQLPNWLLGFSLLIAGLCSYWLSFRNGNIGFFSLVGFFCVLLFFAHKDHLRLWQKSVWLLLLASMLSGLAYLFVKSDPRWQTFQESAEIAIEGDPGKAWLFRKDYPLLSSGQRVEVSAYERISWIKEGIRLSLCYPMGTGFNRNAFFDTLDRDFRLNGLVRGGHSHSGIVDFMIANGILGAALWLAFLAACAWVGWRMVRQGNVAQGLTVVFLVTGFFFRGLVDSNLRDHVLQQFLFLLTIYMTLQLVSTPRVKTKRN